MNSLLLFSTLALLPGAGTPSRDLKLSEAEGKKWVARIEKAVGRDNWSIKLKGNEIILRRTRPVAMVRVGPNPAPDQKPTPDGEKTIKLVLRFAPRMSMDEYERLEAVNIASQKEYDRLHRAVGLSHKFDDFTARTPEEKERVRKFREAVAKLPRHTLPDLYTPDHSIYFLHPWDGWSVPADATITAECHDVEVTLLRLFGMYSPAAAANRQQAGQYLPGARR